MNGIYYAYANDKFCATTDMVESKKASDATNRRDFLIDVVALTEVIQVPRFLSDGLVCDGDIKDIFNPNVISTSMVKRSFSDITNKVDMILLHAVENVGNEISNAFLLSYISAWLKTLQQNFESKIEEIETTCSRTTVNELPFSNWLPAHLANVLDVHGFIVDSLNKLIKPMAPVNEYVNSQADLSR